MKHAAAWCLGLAVALCGWPDAHAAPPAIAQTEIDYLLGFIERSGCQFFRNGTWYDSKQAQAHLRDKYDYLAAMDRIKTTEDFIDNAATKSSMSGKEYAIKCGVAPIVTSSRWLREVLARYRHSAGEGASRVPRDAPQYLSRRT